MGRRPKKVGPYQDGFDEGAALHAEAYDTQRPEVAPR